MKLVGLCYYLVLLSTEWADYVEEPMKYQALRPKFFSMGGWWGGGGGWGDYLSNQIQILKNCHLGVKKIIVNLMKDLKYEHQSIFLLWGRVKLNFRDR